MSLNIAPASGAVDIMSGDFGTVTTVDEVAAAASPVDGGFGAIVDVTATATVEINDGAYDNVGAWRPLLRGDTAAPFTALGTGSYPIATTFRRIRCTVGSIEIRPMVRS